MTLRLLTDYAGFDEVRMAGVNLDVRHCKPAFASPASAWRAFRLSAGCDYALFEFQLSGALLFCLFSLLFRAPRCRLVLVDVFLAPCVTWRDRLRRTAVRVLMRKVHLFLVFVKDTSQYRGYFGYPAERFQYIPYKVNQLEAIREMQVSDDGYIFSGGYSRRDFETLIRAVEPLPWPLLIVTGPNQTLALHGSFLDDARLPPNVRVIRTGGSPRTFLEHMSRARVVAIPTKKHAACQAGIAVYLMAMGLGKCVIVSSGPGVSDLLDAGQAIIVPPGDVEALRAAIVEAMSNDEHRAGFERRGYAYATRLGGTEQFRESIVRALVYDIGGGAREAPAPALH